MPQDIVIRPNKDSASSGAFIQFTGINSGATSISLNVLNDSSISYEGSQGQLLSITDSLTGTVFSVNDISGLPLIDANSSGLIRLGPYYGEIVTNKLIVRPPIQSGNTNLFEVQNASGAVISFINRSGQFGGGLASGGGTITGYSLASGLSSGKNLATDGNGTLYWSSGGGGGGTILVNDDITTSGTRYINFAGITSGALSTIYTASTKLTFNPSTGDFTTGGNVIANSDIKIKKNIRPIENALDKVNALRGVYFERVGTDITNIGVIAQEVEKVLPELVRESDGIKSVAYGNITALLIEAIKEQDKKIKELEEKVCQLKSNQS
jgi:hypothetical protein